MCYNLPSTCILIGVLPVAVCNRSHCNDNVAFLTTLTELDEPANSFQQNEALYLLFVVALLCTNWLTAMEH